MISFASLPMALKTPIATVLFLTMITGLCTCLFVRRRHGRIRLALLTLSTLTAAMMLLLYASIIPAERAKPVIPGIARWFSQQPVVLVLLLWLAICLFLIMVIRDEVNRRKTRISASAVKESLDHLQTGLCFSYPNGLVMLTNHRMNELSHTIFGQALQNGNLFWEALLSKAPAAGVERIAGSSTPRFRLPDGAIWSFSRDTLDGVVQITAADTTRQHQLVTELQAKHAELEAMNEQIRGYGAKVDEYVIARERLETRVNLHGFLGQALLMTRHHLQYQSGDPQRIIDIWQRNIDVLRLEAEPRQETDSLASLRSAARAIGMQVHVIGQLPPRLQLQKLIAALGAETLTNAVRHAGARQLWITIEDAPDAHIIRYTNDGAAPSGPVSEGGGLGTARRKVEAAGGRMTIETEPRFAVILFFGKEVTNDV